MHSPRGAETCRNDSKPRLSDDRGVVLCHSVISISQPVLCAGMRTFNEVRMLNLGELLRSIHGSFFFFFFLSFLWPSLWCMEVPRLGVESELQLPAYATATATPAPHSSCIYALRCSLQQCRILNSLSKARGQT